MGSVFGQGSGPIWFDDIICFGTEARIEDCVHIAFVSRNCDHSNDVSINCLPLKGENNLLWYLT